MTPEAGLEPSDLSATCPQCGAALWAERRGQWTLKSAILKLVGTRFVAKCFEPKCNGEVVIPWLRSEGLRPSLVRRVGIRLDRSSPTG